MVSVLLKGTSESVQLQTINRHLTQYGDDPNYSVQKKVPNSTGFHSEIFEEPKKRFTPAKAEGGGRFHHSSCKWGKRC